MYKELKDLSKSDYYPFHMPGHKRQPSKSIFDAAFSFDITEIDDFDNMHHPDGIIKKLQEKMAALFHSEKADILINGSSSGILTAISAAVKRNGKIIMARNSHKSAYNAAFLRNLETVYIYPGYINEYAMNGGIDPRDINDAIENNPDAEAVFITSPTYEGMLSDIKSIADICHENNIPLIVDAAHGAHFGINEEFDGIYGIRTAAEYADVTIISLHKTLPTFTQTAALLYSGNIIDRDLLREFYSIYQTSSPSYLFMAGIDNCIKLLEDEGKDRFSKLIKNLRDIRGEKYEHIKIIGDEVKGRENILAFDGTKLCIASDKMTGRELYDILRSRYHLQAEMAAMDYCLLMTGIMDTDDAFKRLKAALREIDNEISAGKIGNVKSTIKRESGKRFLKPGIAVRIQEALESKSLKYSFEKAEGKTAASWVYAYPPDIPLIVPGEIVSRDLIEEISNMQNEGINIIGAAEGEFRILAR
ncbi:aminotransferase class I/II-fold pyridoxal phosphate-dependent enzyme [Lachnospiraceae bacterium C1.1]|nr:aminotransferase class I/II-fold pyridoxal phosphate-dependent enzyme [Lachnospiraceae bacterium C1.1]